MKKEGYRHRKERGRRKGDAREGMKKRRTM